MQRIIVITIFIFFSILYIKKANTEIKTKSFYVCDSIKYPKYNFGFWLNNDKSAKVYKINQKKILHYKIQYFNYKHFVNLKIKEFIGKDINLIEIDEEESIQFYEDPNGKYLGGCVKTEDKSSMTCKLINFDLVARKKKPINC